MEKPAHLRQPGIDALKGLACVLIIWHHLAFYGPMSDVLYPHAPALTEWLYDYGRMAVQVFLVIGGFLAAFWRPGRWRHKARRLMRRRAG